MHLMWWTQMVHSHFVLLDHYWAGWCFSFRLAWHSGDTSELLGSNFFSERVSSLSHNTFKNATNLFDFHLLCLHFQAYNFLTIFRDLMFAPDAGKLCPGKVFFEALLTRFARALLVNFIREVGHNYLFHSRCLFYLIFTIDIPKTKRKRHVTWKHPSAGASKKVDPSSNLKMTEVQRKSYVPWRRPGDKPFSHRVGKRLRQWQQHLMMNFNDKNDDEDIRILMYSCIHAQSQSFRDTLRTIIFHVYIHIYKYIFNDVNPWCNLPFEVHRDVMSRKCISWILDVGWYNMFFFPKEIRHFMEVIYIYRRYEKMTPSLYLTIICTES